MRRGTKANSLIVLGSLLLLMASGSVAYFVVTNTAHNVISTSKAVNIELYELAGPEGTKPFSDLMNVKPGETYSKIPYIENIGLEPVWVRARIILLKTDGDNTETTVNDFAPLLTLENLDENWQKGEDGFYYYNSPLSGGEKTEPFFESVKFADAIDEEYSLATYTLTVSAEATQVANNGTSPLSASWTESGED